MAQCHRIVKAKFWYGERLKGYSKDHKIRYHKCCSGGKVVQEVLYTIEFQKRGLPHCHTLLWVDDKDKIQHAADIDHYISAELPDPSTDPEGYRIISEMMVHGPCGPADPTATCMKENVCSKKFPKKFNNETFFDKDGYVHYRRRNTGVEVTRRVAQITRPVGESSEPPDRSAIHVDEIQNFVDGRFICPYEIETGLQIQDMALRRRKAFVFAPLSKRSTQQLRTRNDEEKSYDRNIAARHENASTKLIGFIYDEQTLQNPTAQELQQKAIVCPRNDTADSINSQILKQVAGESTIYRSLDEAIPLKNDGGAVKLLNRRIPKHFTVFRFPPHSLS
ncbi:DNA helicase [Tanacetum coccineum]